jgi:hypothetical protein
MSSLKTILRSLILAIFVIVGLLAIAGEEINLQSSVRVVVVLTLLLGPAMLADRTGGWSMLIYVVMAVWGGMYGYHHFPVSDP